MNTPATAEHRAHNGSPEGILPVLPLPIGADDIKDTIVAAREAAAERDEVSPFDAGRVALYAANVASFCDACGAWSDLGRIETQEQSERLTDFVAGARGLAKKIEDARKAEKKVHDDRGKAVQAAYSPLLTKLDRVLDLMKNMQGDWLRRENARIEAEKAEAARIAVEEAEAAKQAMTAAAARNDVSGQVDAEQALQEAEKAAAAASRNERARAGSATGGGRTMSLRKAKFAVITNPRAVFMHFEKHPDLLETLQRLANAAVRAGESVPGTKVEEKETAA